MSDRWLPISTVTGRLDAFQWRVPLAHLGAPGPVIEDRVIAAVEPVAVESDDPPQRSEIVKTVPEAAITIPPPVMTPPAAAVPMRPRIADAVIPLIHIPDDPGPDAELEDDLSSERQGEGWRRLRGLFW